jgi:hypothetical protein
MAKSKKSATAVTCPCDACDILPTGQWGITYHNQAGVLQCLPFPEGGGAMHLQGDANGPYFGNAAESVSKVLQPLLDRITALETQLAAMKKDG